jgi:chromosome segregation ATPase
MSTRNRFLIVLAVSALGLWGCAQGPASGTANAERLRALENKLAKLEGDFHTVTTTRDQLRKKLTALEDEKVQLAQQVEKLQEVLKERDSLKTQLATRTSERDHLQNQYDSFRKGIKSLLGQAEIATSPFNAATRVTAELPIPRKS